MLPRPSFSDDKIHLEYSNNIKEFESEYSDIKKGIEDAQSRINDSSFTPKLAEIIKNEIFVQEKYLRLISQEISFLKIKDNERALYYEKNRENLTDELVKNEYEAFKLAQKANPKKYIWRMRPGLILPPVESKPTNDKGAEQKKPEEAPKGH